MDETAFDKQIIKLPCRECGQKTPQTVAWLRKHSKFACAACGTANNINIDKLLAGLARTQEQRSGTSNSLKGQ